MALRYFTGFEASANIEQLAASGLTISGLGGRSASRCLNGVFNAAGTTKNGWYNIGMISATTLRPVTLNLAAVWGGFGIYFNQYPTATQGAIEFVKFQSSGSANMARLYLLSDGKLRFVDNVGTQTDTASPVISTAAWSYIEFNARNSTSGAFEVRLDGATVLSGTANFGATNVGHISFGNDVAIVNGFFAYSIDDVYLDDAGFVGPIEVKPLVPIADGSTMHWTNGTAPSNYTTIDEIPSSASDYCATVSTTGTQVALFDMTACATAGVSGNILGITQRARVRDGATSVTNTVKLRCRSGGTDYDVPGTALNPTTSAQDYLSFRNVDPATGSAWTISGLDAAEFGVTEGTSSRTTRLESQQVFVAYQPVTGFSGTIDQSSGATSQDSSGSLEFSGTSAQSATAAAQSASGAVVVPVSGTVEQTATASQQSASGSLSFAGSSSQSASAATQSATGAETFSGAATQVGGSNSQSLAGSLGFAGSVSQSAGSATQAGGGTVVAPVTGTADQSASAATQSATGSEAFSGTVDQSATAASQNASGTTVLSSGGTISQVAGQAGQSASGSLAFTGSAAQTATGANQSATGIEALIGAIQSSTSAAEQAATGALSYRGDADQTSGGATQDAAGAIGVSGSIAQVSSAAVQAGEGTVVVTIATLASEDMTVPAKRRTMEIENGDKDQTTVRAEAYSGNIRAGQLSGGIDSRRRFP